MKRILKIYPLVCLITGLLIIAAGIYALSAGELILQVASIVGGAVVTVQGLGLVLSAVLKRKIISKEAAGNIFFSGLFNILVGAFILFLPVIGFAPIYIVFTAYIFVNALIKIVDYQIDRRDNVPGRVKQLILFLFFIVFGILMVFVPGMGKRGFLVVAGVYCIIYGGFQLSEFVFQCLPEKIRSKINNKITLPMPVLLSTLMPFMKMKTRHRKHILNPEKAAQELKTFYPAGKETDAAPDMEVMIHVGEKGLGTFGHCDLCFEDEVISYGSYDLDTVSLFGGVGDGILVVGKRESYIRFYVTATPREIYSYGFRLTEEQKRAVRKEIADIKETVYPWDPPLSAVIKETPGAKGESVYDWGSKMWNCTGSDFYKFKSGKMKTYFAVTSNCVMMVDGIVRKACSDTTAHRTVLTPGGYYDYLEHLLAKAESPVFCRKIYNAETTEGWQYKPRVPYSSPELEKITETEANHRAKKEKQDKIQGTKKK
ncbi:MAG: hypothetical protein HDT46_03045 [Ruminococcaceae bacterium]|nr:hypothetical protein [Oscillospiraceae bacterium]